MRLPLATEASGRGRLAGMVWPWLHWLAASNAPGRAAGEDSNLHWERRRAGANRVRYALLGGQTMVAQLAALAGLTVDKQSFQQIAGHMVGISLVRPAHPVDPLTALTPEEAWWKRY